MQKLKLISPLSLLILLLLVAGCEIQRPGGDRGDISGEVATVAPAAPTATPLPSAPTEPAAPAPPAAAAEEIDPAGRAAPEPPPVEVEPGKVVIKLSEQAAQGMRAQTFADQPSTGIASLDTQLSQFGVVSVEPVVMDVAEATGQDTFSIQAEHVGSLFFVSYDSGADPNAVAQVLNADPAVEYAEPNFIAGVAGGPLAAPPRFIPNDRYFPNQWHMTNIQMPAAWDISTGQGVVVAVVDTGIDFGAPDLANTLRLIGYDFVNNDNDPTDDQGHGTHVAGTIAQSTNNSIGVAGVAFNARLLPVKVLNSAGTGSYENIIKGIIYAADQGANVINLSLAGSSPSQGLEDAVKYANSKGVTVVAAAGNSNGAVAYPAAYDDYVIGVGAVRFDNTRARYSNFGPEIDLVAPGGDVNVDQSGDGYADGVLQQTRKADGSGYSYQFYEGTSMASPHVAGVAALLLSRKPGASPAEIENILASTALKNLGAANEYGAGLIQAANALAAIAPAPATSTPTPTSTSVATTVVPPVTATFTPTPTPTATSAPVCTPPTCGSDSVLICPGGDCPNGCGVACATVTPSPTAVVPTNTPTFTPSPTATNTPTTSPPTVTPTPSPTFTPTPLPLPAGELLRNGGFETDEAWVFGDTPVPGSFSAEVVRSGSRAARLGITTGPDRYSYSSVWQQATIPAEAKRVTLTANIFPVSKDSVGSDVQNIIILDSRFRVIRQLSRGLSNSQSWETKTYDLTDLAGQTIYVYFGTFNNGWGNRPTALFVDDVSLQWQR